MDYINVTEYFPNYTSKEVETTMNLNNNGFFDAMHSDFMEANVQVNNTGKRMNVSLTPIATQLVETLSELKGITQSALICRAISTEAYIQNELKNGSKILIQKADGSVKEIVFL